MNDPQTKNTDAIYAQDVSCCMAAAIGNNGLSAAEYEAALESCAKTLAWLSGQYEQRTRPLLRLPETQDDLGALEALSMLPTATHIDRLLHYISVLEDNRKQDRRSYTLFAEILGELGKFPADAATAFLLDFLLKLGHFVSEKPNTAFIRFIQTYDIFEQC